MDWRGYFYTGLLLVTAIIGILMIIGTLMVPTGEFAGYINEIKGHIASDQWDKAQETYDDLVSSWRKEYIFLGVNGGAGDMQDFHMSMARLKVSIEEMDYHSARYELEVMGVLLGKL